MVRNPRLILALCASLVAAAPLAADPEPEGPNKQTIVVRDGRMLTLDGDMFVFGKRAFLGVSLIDITPELREFYGAPKEDGVLVGTVEEGSPAAKSGIHVGDIILSVDGKDTANSTELRRALREKKGGDAVRVEVLRNRIRQTVVATVVEREPIVMPHIKVEELQKMERELNETLRSPEWKARIEAASSVGQLQARIKELELKLKELEKKLQK